MLLASIAPADYPLALGVMQQQMAFDVAQHGAELSLIAQRRLSWTGALAWPLKRRQLDRRCMLLRNWCWLHRRLLTCELTTSGQREDKSDQ
jgi:hypothetical protein